MREAESNHSLPQAGHAEGVRLTAYFWPIVTLVYSVVEVCRPHSKWMLSMWWASVASGVVWVLMVPFLERLKRQLASAAVPVESVAPSAPAEVPDARSAAGA